MKLGVLAVALFGLGGPVQVQDMELVQLEQIENSKAQASDVFRVMVTGVEDKHGSTIAPNLSRPASGLVSKMIREAGASEVTIERGLRDKLTTEFQLIEIEGKSEYRSPQAANLAIAGEINNAYVSSEYKVGLTEYSIKQGKFVELPPQCVYTAFVDGAFEFYEINPVEKLASIPFNGSKRMLDPAQGQSCPEISKDQASSLFNEALEIAMEDQAGAIKTMMATSGQVILAHKNGSTYYYRISIKPSAGAVTGVEVDFLETIEIAGEEEVFNITTGEIVCTSLSDKYAYVEVSDPKAIEKIKQGTPVKLSFEAGTNPLGKMLNDTVGNITQIFGGSSECNPR